jgi:hypothetical protein
MALVLNDRVRETTTTTGTGAVALGGAVSGFETFAAGIGNSNTVYYAIVHRTAAEFEVGLGTLDGDSSDLTRTTVISSSNSDSAVNFASGTKDVFCTLPASKAVFEDASSDVTLPNDLILGSDSAVLKFGADSDINITHVHNTGITTNADFSVGDDLTVEGGVIELKNTGAQSELRLYCESSNAHYAALKAPAHSDFSGNTALTLPATTDTIAGIAATQTLTNKSIDSDNNTITNIVNADIKSSAAIADSKLATISTAGKVALSALEIDGGTDIGANLADADLFIVDDGAGGTNRKLAASRIATYVGASAGAFAIANLDIDGGTDIGADLVDADEIIVDDGGGGTNRRSDLERVKKYIFSAVSGDATASDAGALTIANTSVETAMIAADAITEAKIADDAVESEHINDNVISGQTALTSGLATTDELLISDGGTIKKMDVSVITEVTDSSATALAIALG